MSMPITALRSRRFVVVRSGEFSAARTAVTSSKDRRRERIRRAVPWPPRTNRGLGPPVNDLQWGCMTDVPTDELQAFKATFFRALAHPVRIRILELLLPGELSVQELQEALRVDQPVVSQQLAVLRAGNIVSGRKEGVSVRYAIRDPLIGKLLETARQIFNNHLVGTQDLLRELRRERRRR